jgi:RNA polymerase sigma factor (sigma-70 family)
MNDGNMQPGHAEIDLVLWNSFKQGNREAFEKLLQRHYSTLFRYASRFSKNRALVEDCLQDVFVYIWEHRLGLSSPPSVKFYLLKSVRNKMFLETKDKLSLIRRDESIEDFFEEDIEKHLICRETDDFNKQKLSRLINMLPERQREALFLKYFEEMKVEEIGEVMGVNRQSAANFLYRALSALRESWLEKTVIAALCLIVV